MEGILMCVRRRARRKIHGLITDGRKTQWEIRRVLTCVWAMIRITWQYFFMAAKSFSSCFLPSSSCHFLQYLVKAFFLDLYLGTRGAARTEDTWVGTGPS